MIIYAIKEILRKKEQTILVIAGYIIAIILVTMVNSIVLNNKKNSDLILEGTGTHFIVYIPLCGDESCKNQLKNGEQEGFLANTAGTKLISNSYVDVLQELDSVADSAPFLLFKFYDSNIESNFIIGGIPLEDTAAIRNNSCSASDLVEGSFLSSKSRDEIIIDLSFSKIHKLKVGSKFTIGKKTYNIIGIINNGIRPITADIYLPYNQAQNVINNRLIYPLKEESNIILVESKNAVLHNQALKEVHNLMGTLSIVSSYGCYKPASEVIFLNDINTNIITSIIYVFLLLFAIHSQYALIIERKHSIGILITIGWTKGNIIKQIFYEAFIKSVCGWIAGSIFVMLFFIFQTPEIVSMELVLYPKVFLLNFILVTSGGILAGLIPGYIAASLKPSDCLRII